MSEVACPLPAPRAALPPTAMPAWSATAAPQRSARTPPSAAAVVARRAVLVAAIAAVGIVHVWSHTRVTAAGYRLGELQRTQASLLAQRDRLEVEVATLRAPGRLEEFARTRLKMAPPAPGAVVVARVGGTAPGIVGTVGDRAVGDRKDHPPAPAAPKLLTANVR